MGTIKAHFNYHTEKQSAAIREYFRINRYLLQLTRIEEMAGVSERTLTNFLDRSDCYRLSPENIQKILPVLRKLGFEMLSVSAKAEDVIYAVCKLAKMPQDLIISGSRQKHIIEEKQILIYLIKKITKEKHAEIAARFDCMPSNISLAIHRIQGLREVDPRVNAKVAKYEAEIRKYL